MSAFDLSVNPYIAHLPERLASIAMRISKEIVRDMADATLGEVNSFADLHDYVDANTYGGLDSENKDIEGEDLIAIQNALDAWLRCSDPTTGEENV